ncbi:hypothetical protein Tco_0472367 [Tanacetum coccineum]
MDHHDTQGKQGWFDEHELTGEDDDNIGKKMQATRNSLRETTYLQIREVRDDWELDATGTPTKVFDGEIHLPYLDIFIIHRGLPTKVNKARAVMSSASSAVTYTSVYTDSEPGRVFWGADEELSDGGSPRVIVYEYDGHPMQPVAPPSPDYIPGPEEPQTPPVPQSLALN